MDGLKSIKWNQITHIASSISIYPNMVKKIFT